MYVRMYLFKGGSFFLCSCEPVIFVHKNKFYPFVDLTKS